MTLHSLVLISDSFSCNCNSIQSPVSIVHLRVNLILSHPLLRLYISYSISNANQFTSNLHSNVSRSTRINSSSVHTYIFVCFTLRVILQGFVTQNATTLYEMSFFIIHVDKLFDTYQGILSLAGHSLFHHTNVNLSDLNETNYFSPLCGWYKNCRENVLIRICK